MLRGISLRKNVYAQRANRASSSIQWSAPHALSWKNALELVSDMHNVDARDVVAQGRSMLKPCMIPVYIGQCNVSRTDVTGTYASAGTRISFSTTPRMEWFSVRKPVKELQMPPIRYDSMPVYGGMHHSHVLAEDVAEKSIKYLQPFSKDHFNAPDLVVDPFAKGEQFAKEILERRVHEWEKERVASYLEKKYGRRDSNSDSVHLDLNISVKVDTTLQAAYVPIYALLSPSTRRAHMMIISMPLEAESELQAYSTSMTEARDNMKDARTNYIMMGFAAVAGVAWLGSLSFESLFGLAVTGSLIHFSTHNPSVTRWLQSWKMERPQKGNDRFARTAGDEARSLFSAELSSDAMLRHHAALKEDDDD